MCRTLFQNVHHLLIILIQKWRNMHSQSIFIFLHKIQPSIQIKITCIAA